MKLTLTKYAARMLEIKKLKAQKLPYYVGESKTLSTKNYKFDYEIYRKKHEKILNVTSFVVPGKITSTELNTIRDNLIKLGKMMDISKIITNTWIFYEHPLFAEKLGFELIKGTDKQYTALKKKHHIKKILGIEMKGIAKKIKAENINGKIITITPFIFKKSFLPKFEMEITKNKEIIILKKMKK